MLGVRRLGKRFGAIEALKDVSIEIAAGEIRAICGENGAGKSTLVKILTGVVRPDAGTVTVDGAPRPIASPRDAQSLGIALVAQELSLCSDLSVEDNIWLGSVRVPFLHRQAALSARAREVLEMLGIGHIPLSAPVRTLTMGERQLVEIARMLSRDARVLILDEPTATLSDVEIDRIFTALLNLKREGRSVIYITHRLAEVFRICDSVTVLRNGEHVATLPVAQTDRDRLIEMMIGRTLGEMYPDVAYPEAAEAVLRVAGLTVPGRVDGFDLSVARGKIVCVAGQVGSGAEDVMSALAGLVYDASGTLTVNGRPIAFGSTERALASGIMFISGDRAEEGVFRHRSVLDNLMATRINRYARYGVVQRRALGAAAHSLAERVGVDPLRLRARADTLSGGNQQKLAFGRCIDRRVAGRDGGAGVLVMIEPTRGIDVGARNEIYRLMREFCAQGYAIAMTSSDLEEIAGIADEVITLYRGRPVGRYLRGGLSIERIVADITHPVH